MGGVEKPVSHPSLLPSSLAFRWYLQQWLCFLTDFRSTRNDDPMIPAPTGSPTVVSLPTKWLSLPASGDTTFSLHT